MQNIFSLINIEYLEKAFKNGSNRLVFQHEISFSYFLAKMFLNEPKSYLVFVPNLYNGQNIYEELSTLIGENNCLLFPIDEVYIDRNLTQSKELLAQRLYVLNELLQDNKKIVIASPGSFNRYLPDKDLYLKSILKLKVNHSYSIENIVSTLTKLSFTRVNKIDQGLQFALRGDILDVFPINYEKPIRIEFFDDTIESIKFFSLDTQLSSESLEELIIYPSSDLLIDSESYFKGREKILAKLNSLKEALSPSTFASLEKVISEDLEYLASHPLNENYYKYYKYFFERPFCLTDYHKFDNIIIFQDDKVQESIRLKQELFNNFNGELFKIGRCLKEDSYDISIEKILAHNNSIIKRTYSYHVNDGNDLSLNIINVPFQAKNLISSLEIIKKYQSLDYKILICLNPKFEKALKDYINAETDIKLDSLSYDSLDIKEGFIDQDNKILVLSKKELFSYHQDLSLFASRFKKGQIIANFNDLKEGDYLVHETYGIGIYHGVVTLKGANDELADFLKIEYAKKVVLYVPLNSSSLVRKYPVSEGNKPSLSRIGTNEWNKLKQEVSSQASQLTEQLMELYAKRLKIEKEPLKGDAELEKSFEDYFAYPLTSDQKKAINDIFYDMEQPHPMDRLISGDVGFGKTEVCFRAAFKAICSGKQVALLCPTTILAKQHYDVAVTRFSFFGVKIAMLSRLVSIKETNQILKDLKEGKIDFIIGTHRILSKDVIIPKLGLLIIDEEQRFGVQHKEAIKELSSSIDCISLTATPIPRTLEMSLLGIRSMSSILTPPQSRLVVQTYVCEYSVPLIEETISRELARGGQVFYLYNDVSTIRSKKYNELQKLFPNARIGISHAQMDKEDISNIMNAFYNREIDILICSTIVETGIDVPNANTLIIEHAEKFGLSQLYQLRGRVGRSTRVAYCYLTYPGNKKLTNIANKRLEAIKEFTELGSGLKVAQTDLSLRGAGDLLGRDQSGFSQSVSLDLYMDILSDVIRQKKNIKEAPKKIMSTNISLGGYIPSSYALDADKIEIYQEIESCNSLKDIELLRRKIRDIYGRIPKEVDNLISKRRIDIFASNENILSLREEDQIILTLSESFSKKPSIAMILQEKLKPYLGQIILRYQAPSFIIKLPKKKDSLPKLIEILSIIQNL